MNDIVGVPRIYRARISAIYWRFFRRMGIDPQTGDLPAHVSSDRKFATYPYIGTRYGTDPAMKRVLVVGLEVGHDFSKGNIPSFDDRLDLESKPVAVFNPHIAGTYFTALKYACPQHGWDRFKDSSKTCQALLKAGMGLPERRPLSYIALTNFYKWVTKDAEKTAGSRDRINFRRDLETQLFLDEVRVLEPNVVVFQGAGYDAPSFRSVRDNVERVAGEYHVLNHPSARNKRRPKDVTLPRLSSSRSFR